MLSGLLAPGRPRRNVVFEDLTLVNFSAAFLAILAAGHIELIDQAFHFIVSHADTIAVKGIGFNDVRAGLRNIGYGFLQ